MNRPRRSSEPRIVAEDADAIDIAMDTEDSECVHDTTHLQLCTRCRKQYNREIEVYAPIICQCGARLCEHRVAPHTTPAGQPCTSSQPGEAT